MNNAFAEKLGKNRETARVENKPYLFTSPALDERLQVIGIDNTETLERMLRHMNVKINQDISNVDSLAFGSEAVSTFIKSVMDGIKKINTVEDVREILAILTIMLPAWKTHPMAADLMKQLVITMQRDKAYSFRRSNGRMVGLHFDQYGKLLDPETRATLQSDFIENYPLGILPALPLDDIPLKTKETLGLSDPINVHGFSFVSAPLRVDTMSQTDVESYEHKVCRTAEGYYIAASKDAQRRITLQFEGQIFGYLKTYGEWTFVALRGAVQDGKPILVRGGIYEFHSVQIDEDATVVDLANIANDGISITPLRMWNSNNAYDIDGDPLHPIQESLETVAQRLGVAAHSEPAELTA